MTSTSIIIRDNGEPLVAIKKFLPQAKVWLGSDRNRVEPTGYLRDGILRRLHEAKKSLPNGLNFAFRDAWRPAYVQADIYYEYLAKAERMFPNVPRAEKMRRLGIMVAPWFGPDASGHMTGAAMDIRLMDAAGRRLPMNDRRFGYEQNAQPLAPGLRPHLAANRALMRETLVAVGLSNNPQEYWHWNWGDWHWAERTGERVAVYGVVSSTHGLYSGLPCPCGSGKKFEACHVNGPRP
jgi:D-alanyl-D-alanine dipeptidase